MLPNILNMNLLRAPFARLVFTRTKTSFGELPSKLNLVMCESSADVTCMRCGSAAEGIADVRGKYDRGKIPNRDLEA